MTNRTASPTLTDRYVWAVLRCVPSGDRPELELEIRALIADAIEVRTAAGVPDATDAERAALTELGDPVTLAARYSGRVNYLLGPEVYPVWRGLVSVILVVVVPVVSLVTVAAGLIGGAAVGAALFGGIAAAFNVAVQTLFWFTLVFAITERFAGARQRQELAAAASELDRAGLAGGGIARAGTWKLDDLPQLPDAGRLGLGELAAAIVANVLVIVALLWLQVAQPVAIDGRSFPLFDPALGSFWLPWFALVAAVEIVFTIGIFRRGHWTYGYAIGNALLGAAFAVPATWLLANDLLLNPALVDALREAGGTWLLATRNISALVVVGVVAWDAVDGFLKAYRAASAAPRTRRG